MFSRFFVVPQNGQALLGMSYIETLGILTVNCNTVDMQIQNEHTNSEMRMSANIQATHRKQTSSISAIQPQLVF